MSERDQEDPPPRPSRIEVIVSAVVFPGIGQFMQKRWVAATLYFGVGAALGLVLIGLVGMALYAYLALIPEVTNLTPKDEAITVSPMQIAGGLGAFIVVHVLNIVDVSMAYRRRVLAWQRAQR